MLYKSLPSYEMGYIKIIYTIQIWTNWVLCQITVIDQFCLGCIKNCTSLSDRSLLFVEDIQKCNQLDIPNYDCFDAIQFNYQWGFISGPRNFGIPNFVKIPQNRQADGQASIELEGNCKTIGVRKVLFEAILGIT